MPADTLSITFAALADPTRRAILARLASGEASVTELAGPFRISQPAVSKHLKVLERAGLIARSRRGQWRPCRLEARPLQSAAAWVEQYRRFWEERLERLDAYLEVVKQQEDTVGRNKKDQPHAGQAAKSAQEPGQVNRKRNGRRGHARVRRASRRGVEGMD